MVSPAELEQLVSVQRFETYVTLSHGDHSLAAELDEWTGATTGALFTFAFWRYIVSGRYEESFWNTALAADLLQPSRVSGLLAAPSQCCSASVPCSPLSPCGSSEPNSRKRASSDNEQFRAAVVDVVRHAALRSGPSYAPCRAEIDESSGRNSEIARSLASSIH